MKEGWQIRRLVDVATLQRGFDLPTHERTSGDVPLVTSSGISDMVDKSTVHGPGVATGRSGSIGKVFFIDQDFTGPNYTYTPNFHLELTETHLPNSNQGNDAVKSII
jgi:type I restriction enzyme S subunit